MFCSDINLIYNVTFFSLNGCWSKYIVSQVFIVGHSYYILIKINCNKGLNSQNVYPATLIYLPIPSQECVSLCIYARCINFTYIYDLILDFFYSVVYLVFSFITTMIHYSPPTRYRGRHFNKISTYVTEPFL